MSDKKEKNLYDDGNIPDEDLPQSSAKNAVQDSAKTDDNVERLPESTRPRKDGPGGD